MWIGCLNRAVLASPIVCNSAISLSSTQESTSGAAQCRNWIRATQWRRGRSRARQRVKFVMPVTAGTAEAGPEEGGYLGAITGWFSGEPEPQQ